MWAWRRTLSALLLIGKALVSHARLGEAVLTPEAGGCLRKPGSHFGDGLGAEEGMATSGWFPDAEALSSLWLMSLLRRSNLRRKCKSGEKLYSLSPCDTLVH